MKAPINDTNITTSLGSEALTSSWKPKEKVTIRTVTKIKRNQKNINESPQF